jgi:hypothetical protein
MSASAALSNVSCCSSGTGHATGGAAWTARRRRRCRLASSDLLLSRRWADRQGEPYILPRTPRVGMLIGRGHDPPCPRGVRSHGRTAAGGPSDNPGSGRRGVRERAPECHRSAAKCPKPGAGAVLRRIEQGPPGSLIGIPALATERPSAGGEAGERAGLTGDGQLACYRTGWRHRSGVAVRLAKGASQRF